MPPSTTTTTTGTEKNEEGSCSAAGTGNRVFVPLCGKAVDMAYLVTKAKEVIGVEAIQIALEDFSTEHPNLNIKMTDTKDGYVRFEGDQIVLLKGDFFSLDEEKTGGKMDAIWDRASMVAIPVEMREEYVQVMGKLISPGGRILLVTLERRGEEDAMKNGPPFSLPEDIVRGLYENQDWVESMIMIQQTDHFEKHPEDRERFAGLTQLMETVFLIQAKK